MNKKQLQILRNLCGYYFFVALLYAGIKFYIDEFYHEAVNFWALIVIAPLMLAITFIINNAEQNKGDK